MVRQNRRTRRDVSQSDIDGASGIHRWDLWTVWFGRAGTLGRQHRIRWRLRFRDRRDREDASTVGCDSAKRRPLPGRVTHWTPADIRIGTESATLLIEHNDKHFMLLEALK
jgi:hypothetical protein